MGSHLGMAVAKHHSDMEARKLSIVQERTTLAQELHDSLAQTLNSLRFQVRMLEESLTDTDLDAEASADLQRIHMSVEEAHTELRELLNSFRAPIDERGLITAIESATERFGQETGITSYFQNECERLEFSPSEGLQMLRIVQEALVNIRKHANAKNVRILFKQIPDGTYMLLVEDDGEGFAESDREGQPGEHIGLTVMRERAEKLGGTISIDSEAGEGTRVELLYKPITRLKAV
jgi:two-component system nitrate/nitrite sensor histidine kinase NarX